MLNGIICELLVLNIYCSCFRVNEGQEKTSEPHDCDSFPHFLIFYYFGHKIKFLGQNKNIVCDTKAVNNTFNMSTDGGAGSNGQQTSVHIMHLFQGEKKMLPPQ